MSSTKRTLYVVLALLTAIVVVYSHVWQCDFIDYDDNNHVFANEHVWGGLSSANVVWAFTHFHASQWIPLTWISFMVDISAFGTEPGPMHLVNVAFHFINTVLLFGLLWRMTGAYWRSACVAALFALHPINVETVAWITERKSLINTMFWLMAICCHVRWVEGRRALWYILAVLCMAMGVMSKAMIVTLPFTLLLIDVWPLRRFPATPWTRLLVEKIPLFLLSATACIIQIKAGIASQLLWTTEMVPIPFRLACAAENVVHYVGSLVYPTKLAIQYPIVYKAPYASAAWACAAIGMYLYFSWRWRQRAPYLLFGGLWFLGTMVPVSGIVRAGDAVFADRYSYVPQIGFFIAVVWSIAALTAPRFRPALAVATGCALAMLSALSVRYVSYWTDTATLFTHASATWPKSIRAQELAGNEYARTKNFKAAAHHYTSILAVVPHATKIRNSYGISLARIGDLEGAIREFRQAAKDDPSLLAARYNLGTHLAVQPGGSGEAVSVLRQVLREDPTLTVLHYWVGKALEAEGNLDEAREEYKKRLLSNPADISATVALGRLGSAS